MRVSPILMIADDSDLNHECSDWILSTVLDWNDNPTTWFTEIDYFYFVEIIEVSSTSNGDPGWCVRLVEFVV